MFQILYNTIFSIHFKDSVYVQKTKHLNFGKIMSYATESEIAAVRSKCRYTKD